MASVFLHEFHLRDKGTSAETQNSACGRERLHGPAYRSEIPSTPGHPQEQHPEHMHTASEPLVEGSYHEASLGFLSYQEDGGSDQPWTLHEHQV